MILSGTVSQRGGSEGMLRIEQERCWDRENDPKVSALRSGEKRDSIRSWSQNHTKFACSQSR